MQIAVLSGKGGTGKTFVSVNLAYVKGKAAYADCDVEEPNGRLFFKPQVEHVQMVNVMVPAVSAEKCTGCRKCVDFCKFNALAYIKDKLLVFPELCHACRGCVMLCPEKALCETERNIGNIEHGISGNVEVITGILSTGEATGVPIVRKMLGGLPKDRTVFVDCPPGSACTVMESIKDSDYCLMVAEPTMFGIHNLNMVYKLIKLFKKPHSLVINKASGNMSLIADYCRENDIKVIAAIPYEKELALLNSKGLIAAEESERYLEFFGKLIISIEEEVQHEAVGNT